LAEQVMGHFRTVDTGQEQPPAPARRGPQRARRRLPWWLWVVGRATADGRRLVLGQRGLVLPSLRGADPHVDVV